jgi:small subunit ribosomal protein S20
VAHSLSAQKRIRQNVKRRARNRARKQQIKLSLRSFSEALSSGDASASGQALRAAVKKLDQNVAKGTLHKNTASRKKSRLQRRLNALQAKG